MSERPPRDTDPRDRRRPHPGNPGNPGNPGDLERALVDNAAVMLRAARRMSLCEDDARDAVQAATERFLRYRGTVDPQNVGGWLVTVARNEALRVRERRIRVSGELDVDDRRLVDGGESPEELVTRDEEIAVAREALARLKPHERQALWMQAEGRSYAEIADELGWTKTKVNRALTEGRASLRRGLRGIAAGEGCATAGPRIDRLAAGTASAEDLRALRPHVRRCPSCRARLRRARGSRWSLLPPIAVAWLPWAGRISTAPPMRTRVVEAVADRLVTVVPASSGAVSEAGLILTAGMAAVVLGTGVVAGGGRPHHPQKRPAVSTREAVALTRPSPLAAVVPPGRATSVTAGPGERNVRGHRAGRHRAAPQPSASRHRTPEPHGSLSAPSTAAPASSGTGDPSGAPAPSGGAAPAPSGSAAAEFSFE